MDIKPFNSDVGTALVNRISDAIGTLYEPHRIVKKAEAEAKASIIQKEADIKCSELQQRAMQRWIHEETRKQANIESIQEKAIPLLKDDAKPQEMEEDWIAHFFEKCRNVSDEEMQSLWAKILAGEANKSGSFSKRTINTVANLDKKDALAFTKVCSFCIEEGSGIIPLIIKHNHDIYTKEDLSFEVFTDLDALGLISFNIDSGFMWYFDSKTPTTKYHDTLIHFNLTIRVGNFMDSGQIIFTSAGEQLYRICKAKKIDEFPKYILEKLSSDTVLISIS